MKQSDQNGNAQPQHGYMLMKQCPLCERQYAQKDMTVIEELPGTQLLHVTCEGCQHAVLTFVMTNQLGTSAIGMLTDLTKEDMPRLRESSYISEDDVLSFHEMLHTTEKQFIHFLSQ
ncbi:MAG: hypothetical protein KBD15_02000 [Candidatus Magasanikbacteria bacterium]|jgi:hypothetical protein|nr:hypothetical protein [Candidatus Magasanikbacteria bacterium]